MALNYTTKKEWREAFNTDFLYAFILAIFIFLNGLAFSDYIYHKSSNAIGFFINLNNHSNDFLHAPNPICADDVPACVDDMPTPTSPIVRSTMVVSEEEKDCMDSARINEVCVDEIPTLIPPTVESSMVTSAAADCIDSAPISVACVDEIPNKQNTVATSTISTILATTRAVTICTKEINPKNENNHAVLVRSNLAANSYIFSEPVLVEPARSTIVRNTTQQLLSINTNTSHTSFRTPQNKAFNRSVHENCNDSDLKELSQKGVCN